MELEGSRELPLEIEGEPIAALEGRGYLLALRWRFRNIKNLDKRTVHLLDSQTCVSAVVKHQSRASSMNTSCSVRTCKRLPDRFGLQQVALQPGRRTEPPTKEPPQDKHQKRGALQRGK